jgi:hypothetical protein
MAYMPYKNINKKKKNKKKTKKQSNYKEVVENFLGWMELLGVMY